MPIGDLLAQITGGKSSGGSAQPVQRPDAVPVKRKADEDLPTNASKTPRLFTPSAKGVQRPMNGTSTKPVPIPSKPIGNGNRIAKPSPTSKPSPALPIALDKKTPKKGSYAEIMARAQRAQAVMGQVGKIQHKKVEKGALKKDKEKTEVKAPAAAPKDKRPVGYTGTAKPGQRNGANASTPARPDRNRFPAARTITETAATARKAPAVEVEKKVKKAALATTGYTGTARSTPGNPSRKSNAPRGGALLNAPPPRTSASKRRYEDDYDEEMDDFIDYDEDEDDGPRYEYDSDGSSDMEAGMGDIDVEERRAEQIARREDLEEERLEKTLKLEKEQRKRKALETLRAGRRP